MKYDFDLDMDNDNSLKKIINQIEKRSTILEFGPATGRMTKYLKEQLDCNMFIVEIDKDSAQIASAYAEEVIVGDIENFEWLEKWNDKKFDFIIFADVLEHLRNPQKVLSQTKRLLKEEGKVMLSVPNVAHNSILINLFNNIFNYTPVGLLDNTHIHLFAYNTLKFFCDAAGYKPVVEDAIYSDVGENEVTSEYNQVNADVQREFKKRPFNNVYQFVFTLQKKEYVHMHNCAIDKKIIPYTRNYKFQVFFDQGFGWSEDTSLTIFTDLCGLQKIVVPLSNRKNLKALRIDPMDCEGGIYIENIKLKTFDNEEQSLFIKESIYSNAEIEIDNKFFFLTDDANLYFKKIEWDKIDMLEFSYYYLNKNEMVNELVKILYQEKESNANICKELASYKKEIEDSKLHQARELDAIREELKLYKEELEKCLAEKDKGLDYINELESEKMLLSDELGSCKNDINRQNAKICELQTELEQQTIIKLMKRRIKQIIK